MHEVKCEDMDASKAGRPNSLRDDVKVLVNLSRLSIIEEKQVK